MKKKNMAVIGMVVGCLMMVAGAAWAIGYQVTAGSGVVNANGTIRTGALVWVTNISCLGKMNWMEAENRASLFASGQCEVNDDSVRGDWRQPTYEEWLSSRPPASQLKSARSDAYWTRSGGRSGGWQYVSYVYMDGMHYEDNITFNFDNIFNVALVRNVRNGK